MLNIFRYSACLKRPLFYSGKFPLHTHSYTQDKKKKKEINVINAMLGNQSERSRSGVCHLRLDQVALPAARLLPVTMTMPIRT